MEGELSANVRRLRRKDSFAGDAGAEENLHQLVGSLDRLQTACDEALAAIDQKASQNAAVCDSDWNRGVSMKADYEKRLLAEEAFVSAGGEQRFVKKFEESLRRLELFDHALGELERRKEKLGEANSTAHEISVEGLHDLDEELSRIENEAKEFCVEAEKWERLSSRVAPAGVDVKHWTVLRLKAYGDALASRQDEIANIQRWLGQICKSIEEKRAACSQKKDAWDVIFHAKQAFDVTLGKCSELGQSAMENRMSIPMASFCSVNGSLTIDEALKINVKALAKEVRIRIEEKVVEFSESIHVDRSVQPELEALNASSVNITSRYPSFLRIGMGNGVKAGGKTIRFPKRVAFPLPSVMSYVSDDEVSALLLRLSFALPQGHLQVKVIDVDRFGACVKGVSGLARFGVMEIFAAIGDIEDVFGEVETYAADLIRAGRFSGAVRDWTEYNRRSVDDLLPYRILVLDSLGGLSEEQFSVLSRICRRAREIGLCVLVPERFHKKLVQAGLEVEVLSGERLPTGPALERAFAAFEEMSSLVESKPPERQMTFLDVYADRPMWSQAASDGLEATLGDSAESGPVILKFGGEINHVLLGGTTGSGKSNLIHVLIHSLCHGYSPEELRLYLLDYKDGLEFGKYVDGYSVWLPHVESVSVHNDPAYALSMFDYLQRECLRRKKVFAGARSYAEFRRSGGKMPRIVVIIDEFHKLFETTDAEGMSARLMQVLKQGRAYGVHLVLATQTLASSDIPNLAGMLGQIPLRLALRGSEDDRILDPDNMAATGISIPMCVFNDQFGRTKGNRIFAVPEAVFDGTFCSDIETTCRRMAISRGMGIVFNGMQMPHVTADGFSQALGHNDSAQLQVLLGKESVFNGLPLVIAFDATPTAHIMVAASAGDGSMDDNGFLYRDEVVDALKDDICKSLSIRQDTDVVCYNPQTDFAWRGKSQNIKTCPASASDGELRETLEALSKSSARHRIFIVEAFEHARLLHPAENGGGYMLDGQSDVASARKAFMTAFLGNGSGLPFHVVLIMRNFRYAAGNLFYDSGTGQNMLKMFAHRVAVDLPFDDVQTLFPSCLRRDVSGKMFYGSMHTDIVRTFLPYAIREM